MCCPDLIMRFSQGAINSKCHRSETPTRLLWHACDFCALEVFVYQQEERGPFPVYVDFPFTSIVAIHRLIQLITRI